MSKKLYLNQTQSEALARILGFELTSPKGIMEAVIELGTYDSSGWIRDPTDGDRSSRIWLRSDLRNWSKTPLKDFPHTQTGALFGMQFIKALAHGKAYSETDAKREKEIRSVAAELLELLESNGMWDT